MDAQKYGVEDILHTLESATSYKSLPVSFEMQKKIISFVRESYISKVTAGMLMDKFQWSPLISDLVNVLESRLTQRGGESKDEHEFTASEINDMARIFSGFCCAFVFLNSVHSLSPHLQITRYRCLWCLIRSRDWSSTRKECL